jgi:hypothetical protein
MQQMHLNCLSPEREGKAARRIAHDAGDPSRKVGIDPLEVPLHRWGERDPLAHAHAAQHRCAEEPVSYGRVRLRSSVQGNAIDRRYHRIDNLRHAGGVGTDSQEQETI